MSPVLILLILTALAWISLEAWLLMHGEASISGRIWAANKRWPPLSMFTGLIVGLLLGHFFFGQCGPM
jgi:hypothetical protein